MIFSELERRRIERILSQHCRARASAATRDRRRLEYRVGEDWVSVIERRRGADTSGQWKGTELLRLRFDARSHAWSLYVPDGEGGWQRYAPTAPSTNLEDLLEAVDGAPSAIFWG